MTDTDRYHETLEALHRADKERNQAGERERIATNAYDQQQTSQRELELLYQDARASLTQARADAAALRAAFNQYMAATDDTRPALHARLFALHCAEHPGAAILAELAAARKVVDAVIDDTPCSYDHHGYCQAHALQKKGECYMELARLAVAARKEQTNGEAR